MKLLFSEKHIVNLLSTENSGACLKQTLDQASMKQKTSMLPNTLDIWSVQSGL
jgi:hypothetical protein